MSLDLSLLEGSINPLNIFSILRFKKEFSRLHPYYFRPDGLLVFCGSQGSGKTLSAVQYADRCLTEYEKAVFCTNVVIKNFPINCYYKDYHINDNGVDKHIVEYYTLISHQLVRKVISFYLDGEQVSNIYDYEVIGFCGRIVIEYDGIDCIKGLENGEFGVLYLIDEIHLEFNSLESKNVPIEVMVEVSQQRKQRKHIIGTCQVFNRMAKPLREQIKNVVICKKFLGLVQFNRLVDGETAHEVDGTLKFDTTKFIFWFHSLSLYNSYDTYAKMKRYRSEWKGVPRQDIYGGSKNELSS